MTPLDIYVESKDGKNLNFMTFTSHRPPAKSTWETAEGCPDLAWTTFVLAVVLQWNDFQVSVDDNLVFTLKIPEPKPVNAVTVAGDVKVRVFRTPLPALLSTGTEIIVEAAADGVTNRNWVRLHVNGDSTLALSLVVRWDTMDIGFNTRSSGVWSTALSHPNVVLTPNVISNLSIKITDTEFLISVDDNNLFTGPIRVPVQQADAIEVDFTLIKRLQLKYP
ncbi:uncharacterized protein LOC124264825 [Haliotis rubra]|uniref:uncharacterized protein LOC124264825 n=1 Tax=Haliotis rubra TaxID=36100 RepID=UPI001EE50623|nr:uncharacterized protein LOC124264825 [Haliotis rubra]